MAAILSQWPAEASGAVGGPFALVETVGVDARIRRVQLEVAGAALPCPVLRGVEQCLADAARAVCVVLPSPCLSCAAADRGFSLASRGLITIPPPGLSDLAVQSPGNL